MATTHEIRLRSNKYVANLNANIANAIDKVSPRIVDMNKSQLLKSKDSEDKPLIHKLTGSPNLSLHYSVLTNKITPNLFRLGDFQGGMFLQVNENNSSFFIDSFDSKSGILTDNYGLNLFGITKKDQPKSKELTGKSASKDYIRKVWNK
jgi:hypothetical protein